MIFEWWKNNRRDLPWRRTHDPYKIVVSEIMLQQTQVSRVLPKYKEFLHHFPTLTSLTNASPAAVLRVWKGMGYNRRALNLYKLAKFGKLPKSESELVKLPGLGKYTARAVLVFAYKKDIAIVDTNIRQIITHFFFDDKPQKESVIQGVADQLLPKGKSWEWHQALMDYGALELVRARKPAKQSVPFHRTNRFFRGQIIDRLRDKPLREKMLLRNLNKPRKHLKSLLDDLEADGLITRSKTGIISLPE
ncbi:Fe-S cluster assembly protein HesB [Candidatus Gottesmanbacteria bacterium]|nr:Fe-S cluster assembly protein HesB [Candidatus Gottesmanbacteria bacterium]